MRAEAGSAVLTEEQASLLWAGRRHAGGRDLVLASAWTQL